MFSKKGMTRIENNYLAVNEWIKTKSEAPVIYSETETINSVNRLNKHLQNKGYLNNEVSYTPSLNNKLAMVDYKVKLGSIYTLGKIIPNIKNEFLSKLYNNSSAESFLKVGDPLDKEIISKERDRITSLYKGEGLYRFNKSHIDFTIDTIGKKNKVDLILNVNTEGKHTNSYKFKRIFITTDYSHAKEDKPIIDSLYYKGYTFYAYDKLKYNPDVLLKNILIEPDKKYDQGVYEKTIRHLYGLNNFSNVRINILEPSDNLLNAYIFLTPKKSQSVKFSSEMSNSNYSNFSTRISSSYLNRNIFGNAEIFSMSLEGAIGLSGRVNNPKKDKNVLFNAWEYGVRMSIEFPYFLLVPNVISSISKELNEKTIFTIGLINQQNTGIEKLNINTSISYRWNSNIGNKHQINIFDNEYITNLYASDYDYLKNVNKEISKITSDIISKYGKDINEKKLRDISSDKSFIKQNYDLLKKVEDLSLVQDRILEDVFISSFNYSFTHLNVYNNVHTLFNSKIESVGSALYLIDRIVNFIRGNDQFKSIYQIKYARYVKLDFSYSKRWDLENKSQIAFRFLAGVSIPHTKLSDIPLQKGYVAGGANDVRAWLPYDLTPGFFLPVSNGNSYYPTVGNIKLLLNLEYRFDLIKNFEGAFFVDAGNVWHSFQDEELGAKSFYFNRFYKQLGIGYGIGLRYDLGFFILRLDFAMKLYDPIMGDFIFPNITEHQLNFGIGYPF
ncbi:hypothetical protein JBKA6_0089 [Ichthyobacterium seriolicida]|uniref:Bacterial surface antigen (D15) domain-containing protein n=1 Tax=Ichthyobacterium seriolicida TaxID=242600 RepID=A0A1J1E457_9FLAO|nr:hypothetical protein JBKA6_0089 [Ichthyobacterium seriolicida]